LCVPDRIARKLQAYMNTSVFTALFLQPDLLSYRDEMRIRLDRTQSKAAAIFSFPSFKSHCKCSYIK